MQAAPAPSATAAPFRIKLYGAIILVMVAAWAYLSLTAHRTQAGIVTIGEDITVHVDIVATPAARAQGLSGRASLADGEGMLFLFESPDRYGFWMKEMRFPLDLIWIRDGRIVDMAVDVPPPDGSDAALPSYVPFEPADAVLEVPAGFAAKHGLRVGLPVSWRVDR